MHLERQSLKSIIIIIIFIIITIISIIVMTVYTYGCHLATTARGVGRDPGALRNSPRKKILHIYINK